MRKKFTLLLASLLACVGVVKAHWDYPIKSVSSTPATELVDGYYVIYNNGRGTFMNSEGALGDVKVTWPTSASYSGVEALNSDELLTNGSGSTDKTAYVIYANVEGNTVSLQSGYGDYVSVLTSNSGAKFVSEEGFWTFDVKEEGGSSYVFLYNNGTGLDCNGWAASDHSYSNVAGWDKDAGQSVTGNQSWSFYSVSLKEDVSLSDLTINYVYDGNVVATTTTRELVGSDYEIPTIDFTLFSSCKLDDANQTVTDGACTIVVPAKETATVTVELVENLPFTLSTDFDNATWYVVRQHSNSPKTWKYVQEYEDSVAAVETNVYADENLWCFMGSVFDLKIYNKVAGKDLTLTNTDEATMTNAAENQSKWVVVKPADANNKFGAKAFCLQKGGENNYLNQQDVKLTYWSAKDAGSTIQALTEADVANLAVAAKASFMEELDLYESAYYYSYPASVVASAKAAVKDLGEGITTIAQANELQEAIAAAKKTLAESEKIGAPAVGDYIVLKNKAQNKYLTDNGSAAKIEATSQVGEAIWKVVAGSAEGTVKLQNYATGNNLGEIKESTPVATVVPGSEKDDAEFTWANPTAVYAAFRSEGEDNPNRAYGHYSGGNLVGWSTDADATQWVVSKVIPLSLTYLIGDKEIKSTVAVQKGTYTISAPYLFTEIATCTVNGEELAAVDGVCSFEIGDVLPTVVVTLAEKLPFVTTTIKDGKFAEGTEWYAVKHHTNQNWIWQVNDDLATITTVANSDLDIFNDKQLWCFVGNAVDGIQIYNKAAGAGKSLKDTDGAATLVDGATSWSLATTRITTAWENPFCLKSTAKGEHLNHQGNNLKYWWDNDEGSTMAVVSYTQACDDLVAGWNAWLSLEANVVGGLLTTEGLPALIEAFEKAPSKANAAAVDGFIEKAAKLEVSADKCYLIVSGLEAFADTMAIYNNGTAPAWKKLNEADKAFYWTITPNADKTAYAFKNLADNRYLKGLEFVDESEATVGLRNLAPGKYNIMSGGDANKRLHAQSHGNGAGTSGAIVEFHEGDANSASSWMLVEVEPVFFYNVVYEFQYNGKTVATQTKSIKEGADYPEFECFLPYGVKFAAEKPATTVTKDVTLQIPLEIEKALPFKAAADVASINTWYYVQMHANPATTSYIQDNEAGNVEWADRFVAEDEIDSHLWGFAGDVWTGIKVVNKATGKAIVSTKGDAAMGDAANATAFIPTNSQANGNWFCLKYPEANYLNAQSGKVASYGANDNGSSFLLTEYKEGAVEVSDIEYATLYLDYAAYIPEGVEVYVVEKAANGYATLVQVENDANAIPANTGVILKNAGKYTLKAAGAGSVANVNSLLKGSVTDTYVAGGAYVLAEGSKGVGLYKAQLNKNEAGAAGETHFLNNAGKAYLPASAVADASAPMFSFDRGEGTTDIIDVEPAMENVVIYDLTGRRVEKMEKGIYIVNGRKVYVK